MNKTINRVVFFGASKYAIPLIEQLKKHFNISLVVTTELAPNDAVPAYCKSNTLPYLTIKQFNNETLGEIKKANAPLAVLAYFGLILPQNLLDLFPKGIINVHPSLLPKYRGPTPVQSAMIDGAKITGISIIKLDEQVDHGPILAQKEVLIDPSDTADTLHQKLFTLGASLCSDVLIRYYNNDIAPISQDDSKATFTQKLTRESGYFSLDKPPSKEMLDRMVRAYYPWPGVWTKYRIKNLEFRIKFLPKKRLQVEGKKPMTYKDFLNGYPNVQKQLLALLE